MNETLTCSDLFDGLSFRGPSRLVVEDGVIAALEKGFGPGDFPMLVPGYVDIQMNGFANHDVAALNETSGPLLDELLASMGTTTWLGTVVTAPLERLAQILARLNNLLDEGRIPGCAGFHLEGPFLGGALGAHNPDWIVPVDAEWIAHLPSTLRLVTVAPEQPEVVSVIADLGKRGTRVSLGHSRCDRSQFEAAIVAGASLVTHLFNGMSGVHHRDGGLALFALIDDRVRAGLIADMVHVNPESVALAFRSKGPERICLVSDSVAWDTERSRANGVRLVDGAPRLPDGTIAGSSTCLAECVRNVVQICGVDVASALRSATSTPATTIGLSGHGQIKVGAPADVLALDEGLHVLRTWRRLPFGRDQQIDS